MFSEGILLKDALRNVTIILWQSVSPVSMVQVLLQDSGFCVSIRSSKVPFKVLKQVLKFTMLVKGKVSMKSQVIICIHFTFREINVKIVCNENIIIFIYCFIKGVGDLKNVSLLFSIGGLYAHVINHFLFEIVSSKKIVSEILVSK